MKKMKLDRPFIVAVALATVGVAGAVAFSDKTRDQHRKQPALTAARTLPPLGPGERSGGGVGEPSGIAYQAKLGHLFVVGDEGRLAELDAAGKTLRSQAVGGNLEDVVALPSGMLLLVSENSSELILYDPAAQQEKGRWKLDAAELLGQRPGDKSQGFEGLAYKDGLLFLVHQRSPAMLVAIAWDPARLAATPGKGVVRSRWTFAGHEDLTGATYVPSLDRLLVISEAADRLLVVRMDGELEAEAELPGLQQEGLCFDDKGTLWVADDREGGLRRFTGALGTLSAGLKASARASR
jgi:uncharacterized protein YjiK